MQLGGRVSANSVGMLKRLAVLGLGTALLPDEIVRDEVAAGDLMRVLPEWHAPAVPVYALTETRLIPAKTERFIEFVKVRLSRHG